MRQYVVQPGDSPASIAARPDMAGCPKCSVDLIKSNPHKPAAVLPNGFVTFRSLVPGEVLNLPEKWFDGTLDMRPRAYFAALPFSDGVTPSTLGLAAAGVLADYATLDQATTLVGTLPGLDDASFSAAVPDTASLIDSSIVKEVGDMSGVAVTHAQNVRNNTTLARQRNNDLAAALAAGDDQAATKARLDIQNAFSTALSDARLALQVYYDSSPIAASTAPAPPSSGFSTTLIAAAHAAAGAINADPGYCTSVAHTGTPVNSAVHAFKTAWNASQPRPVPINTGNYESDTAAAIAAVIGSAPGACGAHALPTSSKPPPAPAPTTLGPIATVPQKQPLSTASVAGIALLGAGAVGGAVYLATHPTVFRHRIRRVSG